MASKVWAISGGQGGWVSTDELNLSTESGISLSLDEDGIPYFVVPDSDD